MEREPNRVVCATQQGGSHNKFFRDWCQTSDKVADWLWDNSRPHLPRPKKPKPTDGKVITLGDCAIPKDYKKILGLGPKFCFEPSFTPPEKVALTKNLARRVLEEERPRFITECVDVLKRTSTTSGKQQHVVCIVPTVTVISARVGEGREGDDVEGAAGLMKKFEGWELPGRQMNNALTTPGEQQQRAVNKAANG
ncbi:hypothetical protein MRX96_043794 [Rhipicephalus microplus]